MQAPRTKQELLDTMTREQEQLEALLQCVGEARMWPSGVQEH
ncbi:MAG TPA: hypothetical protein VF707_07015 [Ardenticatenaceae bacterium]